MAPRQQQERVGGSIRTGTAVTGTGTSAGEHYPFRVYACCRREAMPEVLRTAGQAVCGVGQENKTNRSFWCCQLIYQYDRKYKLRLATCGDINTSYISESTAARGSEDLM